MISKTWKIDDDETTKNLVVVVVVSVLEIPKPIKSILTILVVTRILGGGSISVYSSIVFNLPFC